MWLPWVLVSFFVVQNLAFNYWLGISEDVLKIEFLLAPIATGLLVLGIPNLLLRQKRSRLAYNLILLSVFAAVFAAQFLYYRYSGGFLQASAIHFIKNALSVKSTARSLFDPVLIFFAAGLLVVAGEYWLSKNPKKVLGQKLKLAVVILLGLTSLGLWSVLIAVETKARGNADHLYKVAYDSTDLTMRVGIINYTLLDAYKYATRPKGVTSQEVEYVKEWAANRSHDEGGSKYRGVAASRNVIIVQVESLEAFVLGLQVNGQEITPNLNRLSREGLALTNHHYHTLYAPTANNEFAIVSSLYPLADGVPLMEYANNDYYALPEHLKSKGYYTAALEGDVATFWNRSNAYPGLGFDKFHDIEDFDMKRKVGWGFADEDLFEQSIDKLAGMPQPFFAKMATLSSHVPFAIPEDLQALDFPDRYGELNQMQLDYLQTINYVDRAIGRFIDRLKVAGLYNNSLIVITGDHGTNAEFHNEALIRLLGGSADQLGALEMERVPLILLAPGKSELTGSLSTPSSHIDLYPTITNLLGINKPKTVLGQDILNPVEPVVVKRKTPNRIGSIWSEQFVLLANGSQPANDNCFEVASRQKVDLKHCRQMHDKYSAQVKASDIIIRGNLLHLLQ